MVKQTDFKTMKKSMRAICVVFGVLVAMTVFGQDIDQARMDRDLKIAENILGTLANSNSNRYSFSRSIESNYVPGYGVIFSLPQTTLVYTTRSGGNVAIVAPSGQGFSYVTRDSDCDHCEETELDVNVSENNEEFVKEVTRQLEENMTIFLVDYADLIGQLKPSDRIMINAKSSRNQVWISGSNIRSGRSVGRTAEISKADLVAMKQGKSSREETVSKIKFSSTGDEELARDLELFSSIFARLYEPDMSNTYYTSSRALNYERLENLGAIYSMKVYSSSEDGGRHTIRTTGESGLTREERNRKVNAMYPEFEQSIKENLLDYGRTIKSLKANEVLIFKIRMTECKGCEMPKEIEVSLQASVLNDFDSGKLSRNDALAAITIKKVNN